MHMADALISPAVGGTLWLASAGLIGYSSKKIAEAADDKKIPLMGVLGAFIFAAQMINFTIPATGSSGHLGGGMILSILLGPHAAFLVMASVLIVQALFFADGGLLALGCNIFNMGFFTCFVAYPLVYRPIAGNGEERWRIFAGAMIAGIVGLQLGAFGVVLETVFSGISALPFKTFVMLMQPVHLGIGIVEGLVTSAVVLFILQARPEVLAAAQQNRGIGAVNIKKTLFGLLIAAAVTAGGLSWFASSDPDGLEWAMFKTSGQEELAADSPVHFAAAAIQDKTAFLPDYGFKKTEPEVVQEAAAQEVPQAWPAVDTGTSVAGLVGGLLTMFAVGAIGFILKRKKKTS